MQLYVLIWISLQTLSRDIIVNEPIIYLPHLNLFYAPHSLQVPVLLCMNGIHNKLEFGEDNRTDTYINTGKHKKATRSNLIN